jgi:regulator of sirC expression with transglutaminase-like and TPR domain
VTSSADTVERFRQAVAGPPDDVPLARSALLIARSEYPTLDVDAYEQTLQQLADLLRERLGPDDDLSTRLETTNQLLIREQGFRGDEDSYDDLRNLWLNDVIDRRTGIPITLAIVYVEVAQRAGLPMRGVGLPGHVVVRLDSPESGTAPEDVYVDVFNGGRLLSAQECRRLVRQTYGRRTEFREYFLSAITPRQILQRLLHNLKARALQNGDEERGARAIDLLLAMYPWDLDEVRNRGMLRERLGDYAAALDDLEQYLRHCPGARDSRTVSESVRSLRRHIAADPS